MIEKIVGKKRRKSPLVSTEFTTRRQSPMFRFHYGNPFKKIKEKNTFLIYER